MPDFGRFFDLGPPFNQPRPELLGAYHGPMNEDTLSSARRNPCIPAGFSALGQFITHDIVATTPSTLSREPVPVPTLRNMSSSFLDLDSVYGDSPYRNPAPRDPENGAKLAVRIENGRAFDDLPRNGSGQARLPDPRNDSNLVVSQLHLAFIKAHNRIVNGGHDFAKAQQTLRLHYQWLVRHEYLPLICGDGEAINLAELEPEDESDVRPVEAGEVVPGAVGEVPSEGGPGKRVAMGRLAERTTQRGLRLYTWTGEDQPFLPVEFTGAAFRFGHSDVRKGYRINDDYWLYITTDDPNQDDLSGGRPVPPERVVSWSYFFDFLDSPRDACRANRIDALLSPPLLRLPEKVLQLSARRDLRSLATRDLQRGINLGLPAGSAAAQHLQDNMGIRVDPLTQDQIWEPAPWFGDVGDPLWYYILREADVQYEGRHLGKLGARIVAETIIGLLWRDQSSILHKPDWRPWLGNRGAFGITDLLEFAELPV